MAVIAASAQPTRSWQQVLEAEVLGAVLASDPINNVEQVNKSNTEELSQRIVAWSLCMLGKEKEDEILEYLLPMKPLTPNKIAKLHLIGWHAAIQKVAKEQLQLLELQHNCLRLQSLLAPYSSKSKKKEPADHKATVSAWEADGFEVVDVTVEPASEVELLAAKIGLLERWIQTPALLRPDNQGFMAVNLHEK